MGCEIKTNTGSLQGKAIQFLAKEGNKDILKLIDEGSITFSNKKRLKNSTKLMSILQDVSDLFKKHGLFLYNGDTNIARKNANLFENLLDQKRLVDRINTKAEFSHNVISSKQFDGKYWVVKTNKSFTKDLPFEKQKEISDKVVAKNLEYINKVNKHFVSVTGREGIKVTQTKDGHYVTFNDSVLQDFNTQSYTHYVNSMYQYLAGKDTVEEDFVISPLIHKMEVEQKTLIKNKELSESQGAKKSIINELDNEINSLTTRIKKLKDSETLEDIWEEANTDLAWAKKILDRGTLSPSEFNLIKYKLDSWDRAGNFKEETHPYLDEEEIDNEYYQERFTDIRNEADLLMSKLLSQGEKLMAKEAAEEFGMNPDEVTFKRLNTLTNRINYAHKTVTSLNRLGHGLAQYVLKVVNEANSRAHIESLVSSKQLAEVYKKVKDSGFSLQTFYQKDENGVRTGNMVNKFSNSFFNRFKGGILKYTSKYKENMFFINPLQLEDENYIKEIELHLGAKETRKYIERAKEKYRDYLDVRTEYINQEFNGVVPTDETNKALLNSWIDDNSPTQRIKYLDITKKALTKDVKGKDTFLVSFPKRILKNGQETGWYDKSFNEIESNEDAYELYNIAQEITTNSSNTFGYSDFTPSSLAAIKKSLMEKYNETGILNFLTKKVYNELVSKLITTDPTAVSVDPLTGKQIKTIKTNLSSMDSLIAKRYKEKLFALKVTKEDITQSQKEELFREASEEIFNESSDNLFMSLNMMNLANLSLKHKHAIEDHVNMAVTYIPNSTVAVGNEYIDSAGNPVATNYINSMMRMVDYTLDNSYYGIHSVDKSSTIFTIRNAEEKDRAKEIKLRLKDPDLSAEEESKLRNELHELGNRVTLNTFSEAFLDWIRLKGLGWNVPAGIANLAQGKIANFIKAVDGRLFNMNELAKAEKLLLSENSKFNNTVNNYAILGDILYEFKEGNKFEEKKGWLNKSLKSLKPYAIQTVTEKSNQGSIMIAMMLRQKVKNSKTGEEKSMWEAIEDTGILSDEWTNNNRKGEEVVIDMISKIKSQVQEVHGDYSNPLLAKDMLAGRVLGMFKGWLYEGVMNRVASERFDWIRGISTKGRYRTAVEMMLKYKANFKQAYQDYKNNKLSDVDAANMRVNLMEAAAITLIYALHSLLKYSICGDDKQCKNANIIQFYVLNMSKRILNETSTYVSVSQWKQLISNPTAAANVLTDMIKLIDYINLRIDDEPDNHLYTKGRNKDRDKGVVLLESQIPFFNQVKRLKTYSGELLNL